MTNGRSGGMGGGVRRALWRALWACGVVASAAALAGAGPITVLHCDRVIAVPGAAGGVRGAATIVIDGERVREMLDGFVDPARAAQQGPQGDAAAKADDGAVVFYDLRGLTVLPGLIDCHTHITGQYSQDVRLRAVTESDADAALAGVVYAGRTVRAGFTTIRNVGSSGRAAFALRDAIARGEIAGPRILEAGESITPTGGHSDGALGYREDLFDIPSAYNGVADGVDTCRQAVRAQVKRGADLIKLTATGGVLSNTSQGLEQQFFDDELRAIVETAHQLGRKVAAHAHGAGGIKAALRAGVDSIEHGTYMDDEAIALFKANGAYYVPTVHAGKFVGRQAEEAGYFPDAVVPKARAVGPQIQATLGTAYRAGVKIAFGTDVGVGRHGTNAEEFIYMHEAGMPMSACLASATVIAAELCGISDEVGTIERGKAADIIAVEGDPLAGSEALQAERVRFVMARGRVHVTAEHAGR